MGPLCPIWLCWGSSPVIHWRHVQVQHGHHQLSPAWASETEFKRQPDGPSWFWKGFHWCTGGDYTNMNTYTYTHTHTHTHIQTTDSLPTLSIIIQYIKPHPQARKGNTTWFTLEKCNFPFLWPWQFTLWHTLIQEMRYFQSWTAFVFSDTSMKHALEEKCCSTSCTVIVRRRGQGWGRVTDPLQLEDHGRQVTVWKALCVGHSS